MKIYTSYFYQVRNFPINAVAFSTAMWDPKWFHDFKDKSYKFKDKRGIWNGLRVPPLVPGDNCSGLCQGVEYCNTGNPKTCLFLKNYYEQLCELDIHKVIGRLEKIAEAVQKREKFKEEPIIILLVYETPKNKCSERQAIHKWFSANGIKIEEWGSVGE